jgi:formylglycine-generating enzyme required for sulfatase activity
MPRCTSRTGVWLWVGLLVTAGDLAAATPTAPAAEPITNGIGMKLVLIPAGEFLMGTAGTTDEKGPQPRPPSPAVAIVVDFGGTDEERPQHRVRITKPFYLGQTEVTQGQWEAVMGSKPWSGKKHNREGADYPASYVDWNDAAEFCRKLSMREGKTYRLPTEAEWEYACRAGTTTAYHFGDDESRLSEYAWYGGTFDRGKSEKRFAQPVGRLKPNAWGLHDVHGNVWEWCHDWYEKYDDGPVGDPAGAEMGRYRVYRGCSWVNRGGDCRSARRSFNLPDYRKAILGLRVVMVP